MGVLSVALDAGRPSPVELATPEIPAKVLMVPFGKTFLTTWFVKSTKKTEPSGPTVILSGALNDAAVAGPPSPPEKGLPFPANALTRPFRTARITLPPKSA